MRRNPYAARIAAEGIHVGRGRPAKGTETGPTDMDVAVDGAAERVRAMGKKRTIGNVGFFAGLLRDLQRTVPAAKAKVWWADLWFCSKCPSPHHTEGICEARWPQRMAS